MRVERQPSPWPTVVMLAMLVAFCLTVPRHWRKPVEAAVDAAEKARPSIDSQPLGGRSALAYSVFGPNWERRAQGLENDKLYGAALPGKFSLNSDLLSLLPTPTIDELIAERIVTANLAGDSLDGLQFPLAAESMASGHMDHGDEALTEEAPTEEATTFTEPLLTTTYNRIRQAIVVYAPMDLLPRLTARIARAYEFWSTLPTSSNEYEVSRVESALRFVESADRVATLPEDEEPTPVIVPDEEGLILEPEIDPWCVPQILFDQLQRIARYDYSREWAERTLADLHVLTERDSLEGDDIQTIMLKLNDAAREAKQFADKTEDDRLRVELLRAHWALARRLDRWSVEHEIHVAARAGERLAARGSLETYFDGLPDRIASPQDDLALQLETYEETRDPQLGRQIVSQKRTLESSNSALERALADAVEQHYRNANVRVAISAAMLNRYIDDERSESRPLRDRIGGATVRGQSHMQSTSRVDLEPATGCWNLEVESRGTVQSHALADGGQAQFRSQTATDFSTRRRILVGATGVLLQPASIDVDAHNRLTGVTTDFDWVPVFATYARGRAVREYRARQRQSKIHVESRVAAEAVSKIEQETQEAVTRVEKQIRERVTDRLAKFGVKVTPIELTTTHERVVARLRVASDDQPSSHTPRPRALSDSLASAQIHETALTNAAVSLELDGKRYTATELVELFQKKFPQAKSPTLDEEKRRTVFQFAKQDAVQFHIEKGQLEVTLSLMSVEVDGRRMRNFVVHAFYTPAINGLEAELVREGSLGIEGRLSAGARARLHNVFNSVLPPERSLPIVQLDGERDPQLEGLMITQLVLEDGWMGLAVGPTSSERVAERSRSLK